MIKISCYKTKQDLLAKAFCQLAQKCYSNSINTCVIANNTDFVMELDRVLWTYSKKYFIPHATSQDPFHQEQPIYITHSIENPNNSKIIILVNPTEDNLLKLFSSTSDVKLNTIEKIMIIFDDVQRMQFSEIKALLLKTKFNNSEISLFEQLNSGTWQATSEQIHNL
ncbi:MAG: DNA polymerase III subunit chi [Rickettsiaceae bacterium]|nr:DNA polymerase III subunit chi [Rickettsiaceae bacterium]